MESQTGVLDTFKTSFRRNALRWLNLRHEESDRTFWMFCFYTATSIGILWLEVSIAAKFLDAYGAHSLPWVYLVSAGIGTLLGFFYSFLQKFISLRRVIVIIAVLMALPLLLFRVGLGIPWMVGYTVFLMRLWMEAIYVLNELNTSITANQLFNIREIKRAYPLISSGVLVADVISGFSLPLLRNFIGLDNVILVACILLLVGAAILFYLSQTYRQFFPDSSRRRLQERQPDYTTRRLRGPLQRYVVLVVAFFVMAQALWLLLDFQYLSQVEQTLDLETIVDFLAIFSAILGLFELGLQWFVSSRMIERLGVFIVTMASPALLFLVSTLTLGQVVNLFWGVVLLRFMDELMRYTVLATTGPVLFQPIPDANRSRIQSFVRGIAEPISSGLMGLTMLIVLGICQRFFGGLNEEVFARVVSLVFVVWIAIFSLVWLFTVWRLRSRYVELLVKSVNRGELSLSEVDLRTFKRAIVEALGRGSDADKKSCIEMLTHFDPKNVGEVLCPLLPEFSPALQRESLEAMAEHPNLTHLEMVRSLIQQPLAPEVLALALRYVWLTDPDPDITKLRDYLHPEIDPEVRGTAASLMLRRGNPQQKAEATDTLRRMLTHKRERERVMGCRALGEAKYMQALRLYIRPLLQDESLRVRCALLEAIAATRLEEYYPSLLRGLSYKSTREAASQALVRLGDEAIPMLVRLGEDIYKVEVVRTQAWKTLGKIGSPSAIDALVAHLMTAWGNTRRTILRILLKLPKERGIEAVADGLGRSGIERLIDQELKLIGHTYAGLLDITPDTVPGREGDLWRRAMRDLQEDCYQRIFLLMRFLYPSNTIQAAVFNLQSNSWESVARGLEILDNTLDIQSKGALLNVLDQRSDQEKLASLSEFLEYRPLLPSDRLRRLLDLRHFLSDWSMACCFHMARVQRWRFTAAQTLAGLRHPTGFVREAALAYLSLASPRTLREFLPQLQQDSNPLVLDQVYALMARLGVAPTQNGRNGSQNGHAKPTMPPHPPDLHPI